MITIYGKPKNQSYIKAKEWFLENEIPFSERDIFEEPLTNQEIKSIFRLSDNGTDDFISAGSVYGSKKSIDIETLTLKELYSLIQNKPNLLKCPIIHDEKKLMAGFNEYQIRIFIPKDRRLTPSLNLADEQ